MGLFSPHQFRSSLLSSCLQHRVHLLLEALSCPARAPWASQAQSPILIYLRLFQAVKLVTHKLCSLEPACCFKIFLNVLPPFKSWKLSTE